MTEEEMQKLQTRNMILEHEDKCHIKGTFEKFMSNCLPTLQTDIARIKVDIKWIKAIGGFLVVSGASQIFYVIWQIIFKK